MTNKLEQISYWMITGEWLQIVPGESPIATLENPKPNTQAMMIRRVKTEFINCHPAKYVLTMQDERPQYAMIDHLQVTRDMFEEVSYLGALARAKANGGGPGAAIPEESVDSEQQEQSDIIGTGDQSHDN